MRDPLEIPYIQTQFGVVLMVDVVGNLSCLLLLLRSTHMLLAWVGFSRVNIDASMMHEFQDPSTDTILLLVDNTRH